MTDNPRQGSAPARTPAARPRSRGAQAKGAQAKGAQAKGAQAKGAQAMGPVQAKKTTQARKTTAAKAGAGAFPTAAANGAYPGSKLNGRRTAEKPALAGGPEMTGGPAFTGGPEMTGGPAPNGAPGLAGSWRLTSSSALDGRPPPRAEPGDVWDERVAGALRFLRRRLLGAYEVDEFGFDPELTETFVYPVLRLLKERYFRIETTGVENLPPDRAALLVANHSGTLPIDALMLTISVHDETPMRRFLRLLGADLVFRVPVLSEVARKAGSTLACNPDAERLLRNGEYVGVFPEGFKGIGKLYRDRYKLQRFGRGGFVAAALRTGTPIVPVAIVGAEEIYPIIGNVRPLAKIAGLPYFPVTPLFPWLGPLGMLPLPSRWLIQFGAPIDTTPFADEVDDPIVVFNLADQVRETIQHTLHTLLERRPDPFA